MTIGTPVEERNFPILAAYSKTVADIEYVLVTIAGGASQALKAAAAGTRGVLLLGYLVTGSANTTLIIEDSDGANLSGTIDVPALGGHRDDKPWGITKTPATKGLTFTAGAGGNLNGTAQIVVL